MSSTITLRFPIELPGGTIDHVIVDYNRKGLTLGKLDPEIGLISIALGLPVSVVREIDEYDYIRILLEGERLGNALTHLRVVS